MRKKDKLLHIQKLNENLHSENSLGGFGQAPTSEDTFSILTNAMIKYSKETSIEELENLVGDVINNIKQEMNDDGMTHDQYGGEMHGY